MTQPPTQRSEEPRVSAELPPTEKKYLLDRYEGGLIVALLVLVVGAQVIDQVVPMDRGQELRILPGQDSGTLGPVDLLDPPNPQPLPLRDLNTISRGELMAISGIGPAMAEAILSYRQENGSFRSMEELSRVPGIGPKRLEQFSKYLTVSVSEAPPRTPLQTGPSPSDEEGPLAPQRLVGSGETLLGLNSASHDELLTIPGIGESFAQRILDRREELGRFRSWDDLDSVAGIGPKRLENLKAHATID